MYNLLINWHTRSRGVPMCNYTQQIRLTRHGNRIPLDRHTDSKLYQITVYCIRVAYY